MYDLVVVADTDGELAGAFAEAFVGRDRRQRVAVVLPQSSRFRSEFRRLQCSLDSSEITLIRGHASRETDPHYLNVDGRLVYGESIVTAAAA